jgi:hypothetical protein
MIGSEIRTVDDIQRKLESSGAEIVLKVGWFWGLLNFLVKVVTFGKNQRFSTNYATTIGKKISVPVGWIRPTDDGGGLSVSNLKSTQLKLVIAHECVHVEQQRRIGLGSVWVGMVPWAVAYLLLPLPYVLAYFRMRFECEAYTTSVVLEVTVLGANVQDAINEAVDDVCGGGYGWSWPFKSAVRRSMTRRVSRAMLTFAD